MLVELTAAARRGIKEVGLEKSFRIWSGFHIGHFKVLFPHMGNNLLLQKVKSTINPWQTGILMGFVYFTGEKLFNYIRTEGMKP